MRLVKLHLSSCIRHGKVALVKLRMQLLHSPPLRMQLDKCNLTSRIRHRVLITVYSTLCELRSQWWRTWGLNDPPNAIGFFSFSCMWVDSGISVPHRDNAKRLTSHMHEKERPFSLWQHVCVVSLFSFSPFSLFYGCELFGGISVWSKTQKRDINQQLWNRNKTCPILFIFHVSCIWDVSRLVLSLWYRDTTKQLTYIFHVYGMWPPDPISHVCSLTGK